MNSGLETRIHDDTIGFITRTVGNSMSNVAEVSFLP